MTTDGATSTATGTGAADRLRRLYGIGDEDVARIRACGDVVLPRVEEHVARFYDWMRPLPEFDEHFSDPDRLASVQALQRAYWHDFFKAPVDDHYVAKRRRVGEAHARVGLSLESYFAAMSVSLDLIADIVQGGHLDPSAAVGTLTSVSRLLHLDTAVVVGTFTARTQTAIAEQGETLVRMSTPVTEIWDGILLLPIVGIIDSRRAQDMMGATLAAIARTRARSLILDIGGVAMVDTAVANHLIKISKAARLMGCECTFSGISPAIAQTLVELGIEVGDIHTTATLGDALEHAFRRTGVDIRRAAS